MIEFLLDVGLFAAKALVIVVSVGIVIGLIVQATTKSKKTQGDIEVTNLNERFRNMMRSIKQHTHGLKALKAELKQEKKKKKSKSKGKADSKAADSRVFFLEFLGDIKASEVEALRHEVSAVLTLARPEDEVVVSVESPGGVVHGYGLAASQLARFRDKNIPLTICVDKVAASGGYMMASVADKVLAAPFAIVGSIGVVAQLPNFHRLLKKNHIDFTEETAGEFKRTVSLFGEITEPGREKFRQQLEETHQLFKEFITHYRPKVEIDKLATGEYWYGKKALELHLIDEIQTSDDYLMKLSDKKEILKVKYHPKENWKEKLPNFVMKIIDKYLYGSSTYPF